MAANCIKMCVTVSAVATHDVSPVISLWCTIYYYVYKKAAQTLSVNRPQL